MKAMIFAAGLGTRLRPLTDDRPKALVEVGGVALLEIALRRLRFFGVREVMVNVHHFAGQIESFLARKHSFGMHIEISDERELLLDTGGGLKKAAWFFAGGAPFLVLNADVLCDLDLRALYEAHLKRPALATLAIRSRSSSRVLLFDEDFRLSGWRNQKTGEERWSRPEVQSQSRPFAFSGIQVIDPALFEFFPEQAVFSTIELFLKAGATREIRGFLHDDSFWLDVGRPEALAQAGSWLGRLLPPDEGETAFRSIDRPSSAGDQ